MGRPPCAVRKRGAFFSLYERRGVEDIPVRSWKEKVPRFPPRLMSRRNKGGGVGGARLFLGRKGSAHSAAGGTGKGGRKQLSNFSMVRGREGGSLAIGDLAWKRREENPDKCSFSLAHVLPSSLILIGEKKEMQ